MGKALVLTEKPSVARDIANALGVSDRHEGYMEGRKLIVTWALGHLLEAIPPEGYNPELKTWRLETLPILPEKFEFQPIQGKQGQLGTIRNLMGRSDVDSVVIATDAGREGELIARLILDYSGCRKKTMRFWTSQALTPEVIREGMKRGLRPASEFDRIYHAGFQRAQADWLVGMNLSRCATIKLGDLFSIGRVQTAALALLVDRRRHREKFKPEPFWTLRVHFENDKGFWIGTWFRGSGKERKHRIRNRADAENVVLKIQKSTGKIVSVAKQKKKQPPPFLYSLTDLQRDANKKFGSSAQKTLDIAQRLYEKHHCISYPRTDSRVLGSKNVDMARNLVRKLARTYQELFSGIQEGLFSNRNKRVFNDARLTDHHALIPLLPAKDSFNEDEKRIYDMILMRFAAAFYPDYQYESTEVITGVKNETFLTRGRVTLKPGWQALYQGSRKDKDEILPPLAKGDPANVRKTETKKEETKPLSHYTENTLLEDMTNPAKYVQNEAMKELYRGDVGLGTQATRAQIIETLLSRRYAERIRRQIKATDKGCTLIDYVRQLDKTKSLASPEETAKWEQTLNAIALGEGNPAIFKKQIKEYVTMAVGEFKNSNGQVAVSPNHSIGKCPACGGDIIKGKKGYGCANWKEEHGGCKFVIWNTIAGKELTIDNVETLLKGKTTPQYTFTSKKKKEFKARLKLEQTDDGVWKTIFVFSNAVIGKCPACGGEITETPKAYGCSKWKQGCKFVIWKTIAGKTIPSSVARQLITKGRSKEILKGFKSKKGKEFEARLVLDHDGGQIKVAFAFE